MPRPNLATREYLKNLVFNAPRLKLVQMLYDEAVSSLNRAEKHLDSGDMIRFRASLVKAQEIVGELFASLNYEQGGEIADNLAALYQFSITQLIDANLNKAKASIQTVQRILSTLEAAWDNISDENPSAGRLQ